MKRKLIVDVIDAERMLSRSAAEPFSDRSLGSPFTDRVFRAVSEPSGEAVATIVILNGASRAGIALETNKEIIERARAAGPVIFVSLSMAREIGLHAPKTSDRGEVWVEMVIPFGIPQPVIHFRNPLNRSALSRLGDALRRYTQVERFGGPTSSLTYDEEEAPSRDTRRTQREFQGFGASKEFGRRQKLPTLRQPPARTNVNEMPVQERLAALERVMGARIAALERRVADLEAELRVAHAHPEAPGPDPAFEPRGMTAEQFEVDVQNIAGQFFTIGRPSTPLITLAGRLPRITRQQLGRDQAVLLFYRSGARLSQISSIPAAVGRLMQTYGYRRIAVVVLATSDPDQANIRVDGVEGVFTLRTSDDYATIAVPGRVQDERADRNVRALRALAEWMQSGRR